MKPKSCRQPPASAAPGGEKVVAVRSTTVAKPGALLRFNKLLFHATGRRMPYVHIEPFPFLSCGLPPR